MAITGKGRCNITNVADIAEIIKNIPGNGKFLHSALRAFDNRAVVDFFEQCGVKTKVERGGRVFPASDRAADAVEAMTGRMAELGVEVVLEAAVQKLLLEGQKAVGAATKKGEVYRADAVIVAAGGASYPATGSAGDGAKLAARAGLSVTELLPALVPLETEEEWVKDAQGLSLRNVGLKVIIDGKKQADFFGEMMFTHFGITGPMVLTAGRNIVLALKENKFAEAEIDLKPALDETKLDGRLLRDFDKYKKKELKNSMGDLLPAKLIAPVIDASYIDPAKTAGQITKEERRRLINALKHLTLTITRPRPIAEAIVTMGGVAVKEINPKTMAAKRVSGLYFAGEVLDIDGYTGGFNLQAAFSTGRAAGFYAAKEGMEE